MSEKNEKHGMPGLSDTDIMAAMREMDGYIDITPADFREIYSFAYHHALKRLTRHIRASDIMTKAPHTIMLSMGLLQAAQLLADKGISGAPVVDQEHRIAGVISEKDFLSILGMDPQKSFMQVVAACLGNQGCLPTAIREVCVSEIMSLPPVTASPDTPLCDLSTIFREKNINRIPITDSTRRVIGIVTRSDLANVLGTFRIVKESP